MMMIVDILGIFICQRSKMIEKQHLFSLTEDFLKYLNKQKIYNINLTHKINKAYKYDYEIKQQEAHKEDFLQHTNVRRINDKANN